MARTITIPPFGAWIGEGTLHADAREEAERIMGIIFPEGGWAIEPDGGDGWLVDLPTDYVTDVLFSGGYWSKTGGDECQYSVEIELP